MREFGKISVSIWRSKKFLSLGQNDDARLLYFYLHTCPHVNSAGCFILPEGYACADLGWEPIRYRYGIETLSKAYLIGFDEAESLIRIVDYLKHGGFANPKHAAGTVKLAMQLPQCLETARLFRDLLDQPFVRVTPEMVDRSSAIGYGIDTVSIGYANGFDTERERERERKNMANPEGLADFVPLAGSEGPPAAPAAPAVAATAPPPPAPDPDESPVTTRAAYTAEFEAFWLAYPRREKKRDAFLAWGRAKKRAKAAAITEGAAAYAKRVAGSDPKFIRHPATWLNGDSWLDEAPLTKAAAKWSPFGSGGYVPAAANGG